MTYKVHLDGYNFLPYFKGVEAEAPRREFYYFADTGVIEALRYNQWKIHFRLSPENIWDRGPELKVFPQLLNQATSKDTKSTQAQEKSEAEICKKTPQIKNKEKNFS